MDWEKVSEEMPVEDDTGRRPTVDDEGNPRPTEEVEYEALSHLQFRVDDMASAKDRRFLTATLDHLSQQKVLSSAFAADFETSLAVIISRFVRGVLDGEGTEHKGRDAVAFLTKELEYDDGIRLLHWLREKCTLAASKKKSLRQPSV